MAEKALKQPITAEDRQFNRNKWLFSVSGIGRDMSYQLIASFLLTYIQFGMTLSVLQFTVVSLIIGVIGRIWDAVNDPMMGAIIEGTHMKYGKFRPWILIGAILTGAIIITMFNVQTLQGWNFVVFMGVMYLLWESAFTMNDIGYWSMLASLSSKRSQRDQVTMLTLVFAGIGAFAAQGGIAFLYPGNVLQAFSWISIAIAAIFVIMQVVMAVFIRERPRAQMEVNEKISLKHMWKTIKGNDQVLWMTLSMLFYNIGSSLLVALAYNLYYLEIGYDGNAIVFVAIFGVFNILAQALYPYAAKLLGRKKLQIVSVATASFGYFGIALLGWTFIPFDLVWLSVFGVFVFVGQAMFYMASIINMTNCVEYNEYKTGERNEAVVSTLRPFMAKFADALKYGIVTLVLTVSMVYGLSQNISTIESQKGYFDRMETVTEQTEYLSSAQKYITEWDAAAKLDSIEQKLAYIQAAHPDAVTVNADSVIVTVKDGDKVQTTTVNIDGQAVSKLFDALLQYDEVLGGRQLQSAYISAIGDAAVMKKGAEKDEFVDYVRNLDVSSLSKDGKYVMAISGVDANGKTFNAGDKNFKSAGDMSMRVWLRLSVTVVPILFLVAALLIQTFKFKIDEKFYDEMLIAIDARKAEQQGEIPPQDTAGEPAAEQTDEETKE